jgi:nucleoid-associated protein YgaU
VAVLIALVGSVLWMAGRAIGGGSERSLPTRYRVQAGDTLWAIARRRVGPEGDPRPVIAEIREASGLATSSLVAGQTLVVPDG